MKPIEYETTTKDLPVKLSPEEVFQKGQELGRSVADVERIQEEAKASAAAFAQKLKARKLDLHNLAKAVTTGQEIRPILCTEKPDARLFRVDTIRHDTMQIVETRPMDSDELEEARQGSLFARRTSDSTDEPPPGQGAGVTPIDAVRAPETTVACPGPFVDGALAGCAGKDCTRCAGHGMIPVDALDSGDFEEAGKLTDSGVADAHLADDAPEIDDPEGLLAAAEAGEDIEPH